LPLIVPSLSLLHDPLTFASFVFFTAVTSLNIVTNAVFLAFKHARYVLVINALFSLLKIILPFVFAGGGAATIFALAGCAQLFGLALSVAWMVKRFGYRFSPRIHTAAIKTVKKFSAFMYVSSICNLLPPTMLPLIIVHDLGSAKAAYYYMAFTMASLLYAIVYATMQSAFAEGSHNQKDLPLHITKAAKLIGLLLLPSAAIAWMASDVLLAIFGHAYATQASELLKLFAIGALPVAGYTALSTIFKVTKNLQAVVVMNVAYAITIIGLCYYLVPSAGLIAAGWAWLIGNLAACLVGTLFLLKKTRSEKWQDYPYPVEM